MTHRPLIAVVGAGGDIDVRTRKLAERVGELVAGNACVLLTGGLGGVMEAASAGARRAGGTVIGLLPGSSPAAANPHVEIAIASGLGEARNAVIATAAGALIAVGGEYGTLSEIAFGLKLGKTVVALACDWSGVPGVREARSPEEAVRLALPNP
jgi:uncharacterized protein (TIGR00725 family)